MAIVKEQNVLSKEGTPLSFKIVYFNDKDETIDEEFATKAILTVKDLTINKSITLYLDLKDSENGKKQETN